MPRHGALSFPSGTPFLSFASPYSELVYRPALLPAGPGRGGREGEGAQDLPGPLPKEGPAKGGRGPGRRGGRRACPRMQNIPSCFRAWGWRGGSGALAPSFCADNGRPDSCAAATKAPLFGRLCLLSVAGDLWAALVANTDADQAHLIGFLPYVKAPASFPLPMFPNNLIDSPEYSSAFWSNSFLKGRERERRGEGLGD